MMYSLFRFSLYENTTHICLLLYFHTKISGEMTFVCFQYDNFIIFIAPLFILTIFHFSSLHCSFLGLSNILLLYHVYICINIFIYLNINIYYITLFLYYYSYLQFIFLLLCLLSLFWGLKLVCFYFVNTEHFFTPYFPVLIWKFENNRCL